MNLRPAIKTPQGVVIGIEGSRHDDMGVSGIRGFVAEDGKFLSRIQALKWVRENQPEVYAVLSEKEPLHSSPYADALTQVEGMVAESLTSTGTDLSKKKALVIDYGYFMNLARRLAEKDGFGEVVYAPPWHSYNPTPDRASVGMGIPGITHAEDYADHVLDADIIIFPDVGDMALQRLFRQMKADKKIKARIFGMGDAERCELDRQHFKGKIDELGLFQPEWGILQGVDALRKKLQQDNKLWIKIPSKYRGIKETWYHDTYKSSKTTVDMLAHTLGVLRDSFTFIWEKPYGDIEGGSDYWVSGGKFLPVGWQGFEEKNELYLCKASRLDEMPKPARIVHDAMAGYYLKLGASGKASDEIRTDKTGQPYYLDATMRFGDPPFGIDIRGWKNFPQIIWAVAGGEIIEPEPVAPYAAMVVLKSDLAYDEPCPVDFEDEADDPLISLRRLHIAPDGQRYCIPLDRDNIIGSAVGFGPTAEKAAEQALYYANRVRCKELYYNDSFDPLFAKVKKAEGYGWGKF